MTHKMKRAEEKEVTNNGQTISARQEKGNCCTFGATGETSSLEERLCLKEEKM